MGGEIRHIEFWFSVKDCEQMPRQPNGDYTYADDVIEEIENLLQGHLMEWYETRGKDYLDCDPTWR